MKTLHRNHKNHQKFAKQEKTGHRKRSEKYDKSAVSMKGYKGLLHSLT